MNNSSQPPANAGERLRELRLCAGLSAKELDRLARKTEGHCTAIENKIGNRAQANTFAEYARVLGASAGWIAFGEGEIPTADGVRTAVEKARAHQASEAA